MQCNLRKFSTLVYHQFLSSIKKDEHKKENWFFFCLTVYMESLNRVPLPLKTN